MVQEQTRARTIVLNPRILLGEPTIEGTRLAVRTVVLAMLYCGTPEEVVRDYPSLTVADVETALKFYREYRHEINIFIAENNEGEDIPFDELERLSRAW